jgi:hypothetical protein
MPIHIWFILLVNVVSLEVIDIIDTDLDLPDPAKMMIRLDPDPPHCFLNK